MQNLGNFFDNKKIIKTITKRKRKRKRKREE
jgi:hypothetical protein